MALNTCKMWFNGIKIAVFSKKLTKNRPTAGGFAPRPPAVIRLRYTSFLNTSPSLDIWLFNYVLLIGNALSLCKILVKCQPATILDLPSYDLFVPQKVSLLKIFHDVIACDMGPPYQSKILATPINWRLPKKLFLRTFCFLENTCGCVLGLEPSVIDSTSENEFKQVWTWPVRNREQGYLTLWNDFWNLARFFQMALKWIFFWKIAKIAKRLGVSLSDPNFRAKPSLNEDESWFRACCLYIVQYDLPNLFQKHDNLRKL